ncbi:hypothetical protein ACLB2K_076334 [Fragaria x ananassa]
MEAQYSPRKPEPVQARIPPPRDAQLLVKMGATPTLRAQKRIRLVLWHPPLSPWIKLNTDGLAKGNPELAACGGVFRDYQSHFIGRFSTPIGHHNAFFSELLAVIIGIELTFQLGWQHVWLECDSTSVVECFSKSSFVPPWQLRNTVADRLANLGMSSSSWIWHASPPAEIIPFLRMDFLGFPYIRHG